MKILSTANIPTEQLDELEGYAMSSAAPELRDVSLRLSRCARDQSEIALAGDSAALTPSQASKYLGMSRTQLYKLLDPGDSRRTASAAIVVFRWTICSSSRRNVIMTVVSSQSVSPGALWSGSRSPPMTFGRTGHGMGLRYPPIR